MQYSLAGTEPKERHCVLPRSWTGVPLPIPVVQQKASCWLAVMPAQAAVPSPTAQLISTSFFAVLSKAIQPSAPRSQHALCCGARQPPEAACGRKRG